MPINGPVAQPPVAISSRMSNSADVSSIDAIIKASYDTISGPAGAKRDWDRERSLFAPGARLIPTATVPGRNDVDLAPLILDVEAYIQRVEPLFADKGFYETEVARRTGRTLEGVRMKRQKLGIANPVDRRRRG